MKAIVGKELEEYLQQLKEFREQQAKSMDEYLSGKKDIDSEMDDILWEYSDGSNRWQFFCKLMKKARVTERGFNIGLKVAWMEGVATGSHNVIPFFKKANRQYIMDEEELSYYNNLPDNVILYRGCSKYEVEGEDSILGFSWTTERKVAEFFAFRYRLIDTAVYSIEVPKKDIKAIFLERYEFEAIYLDAYKHEVALVTDTPTECFSAYLEEVKKYNS